MGKNSQEFDSKRGGGRNGEVEKTTQRLNQLQLGTDPEDTSVNVGISVDGFTKVLDTPVPDIQSEQEKQDSGVDCVSFTGIYAQQNPVSTVRKIALAVTTYVEHLVNRAAVFDQSDPDPLDLAEADVVAPPVVEPVVFAFEWPSHALGVALIENAALERQEKL